MSSLPSVSGVDVAGTTVKKGSAWITAKASERSITQAYSSDPKFKKYIQQVEKCLNTFDDVHEWADCIAFLKQLLKTFQTYQQFKEIPKKLVVAKRLSQCLNPALPTGVHQRALEVYIHILTVIGPEGLKRDLPLWSSGLFPFFEYSATSVKPTLLNIYETHYLPLGTALRPMMKSFTLALLPGLEEETGEFFDKVVALLDKLSNSASLSFFFQNIWLVMLTTPSARGTSLNYLSRRLPRLNPDEDITDIVGKDIGLMIRAFAAALEDENLLVRRGALDLLLQAIRVDSLAIRKAQAEDKAIIMRAAVGVVLRRDISLNRRLYSWLLGPEERPENPIGFYKEHALNLLYSTLKNEMFNPSGEYAESRPFKIFISLLDKWEIGSPLADMLVYDAFKAIKSLMDAHSSETGEDLMMTASTLYEALEPEILWKPLLSKIFKEISGDGTETDALDLAFFILDTFTHDEEIQANHFPTIISALLDLLDIRLQTQPSLTTSPAILRCLSLLEEILRYTPHLGLADRTPINPPNTQKEAARATQRPYLFACSFYDIEDFEPVPESATPLASASIIPFTTSFNSLFSLSVQGSRMLAGPGKEAPAVRQLLGRVFTLAEELLKRLKVDIELSWDPTTWMNTLLQTFEYETTTFSTVDRIVTLICALSRSQLIRPRLNINDRSSMRKMVTKLLQYLKTDTVVYHARAVHLICSLETSTPESHVESVIAQTMSSPQSRNVAEAYEAFGILWRLSEDSMVPGFRFRVPLMIVLETLTSHDPGLYRIGETWMRCSLKSYLRILDPILYDLLDPTITRTPNGFKVEKREIAGYLYERPFDQRLINHLLEVLLSVVSFAGQGFAKAAVTSAVKRSHHAPLVQRVESMFQDANRSYLDVLIEVLLRFIQSEPTPRLTPTMKPLNLVLQSTAVQLLQLIVSRGEFDQALIGTMEAIVIGKLYYCVHTTNLDIQNKLLHLLHSIISLSISRIESIRQATLKDAGLDSALPQDKDDGIRYSLNPLLIQVLIDGISVRSNRPVTQHWLDFILGAVPQFQPALQPGIVPLNDCICRQLSSILGEIVNASRYSQEYGSDLQASATELDLVMLINGLERLVLLGLAYTSEADAGDDDASIQEKTGNEGSSGLLGYVSTVFSGDGGSGSANEQSTARVPGYRSLDDGIRVLYLIWGTMVWKPPSTWSPREESLSLIYTRSRARCRRALEHLFRVQPMEVFESIVDWWYKDVLESSPDAAFELVDILMSTAQNATHMLCESISSRISTSATRKAPSNSSLTDAVLFKFMEQYFQRLEGPLAVQVWGRYLSLVKDLVTSTKEFKTQNFPALRCMSVLSEKVTQTTAMEDKRVRKELQDNYGKLLDSCILFVGRSSDQGSWIRRSTKEAIVTNGRNSPAPRADSKNADEKLEDSLTLPPDSSKPPVPNAELLVHITNFIAKSALPNLRRFLLENDKVIATCNNIVYYIVNPAMRGKTRPMDVEPTVIAIISEMTKIPASLKSWRTAVIDLLSDNRVFNSDPEDGGKWRPIIKALYNSDKTAFSELLTKVGAAPSANIFTNKEYEMLLRSLNIRRLSFVLFSGENNSFLTQLPTIQEKLVDVFRNVTSPVVQSEVFLCIRVLLCRLSPHNLTSFWPVVLTELYRIFEQVITSLPADGSEDLQLVLAASKCLDLLLVLQTEEFQVHQWIFVTDTVDAIYRPEDWFPEAMLDQLAEIASSLPIVDSKSSVITQTPSNAANQRPMRRPLLGSTRQIDSMRDLVPFFSNVSISSYESVYASGGNIDWEMVEKGIMEDMFDGR